MLEHMTTATAITGLIGLGIGTGFGFVLSGMFGSGREADLRDIIAARDLMIEALNRRLDWTAAENLRMRPRVEAHLKTLAQREAALAKAREVNAERAAAKASNVEPIGKKRA